MIFSSSFLLFLLIHSNPVYNGNISENTHKRKSYALAAAYTDESLIQRMLGDKERVRRDILQRVMHWETLNCNRKHQNQAGNHNEKDVALSHADIQRLQELEEKSSCLDKVDDTNIQLDANSISIIEEISESIDWYRQVGVPHTVSVPKKRKRKNNIFRRVLRKTKEPYTYNYDDNDCDKNILLNCRTFLQSNEQNWKNCPNVVVLTGWGESHVKYSGIIRKLYNEGFNVYTFDHRCQGLSSRSIRIDNPQVTDIDKFDDYVDDFLQIFWEVIAPNFPSGNVENQLSLVAHSMGCLVGMKAHASMNGMLFNKAVLVCPLFEPQTPFPARITLTITQIFTLLGRGNRGATGEKLRGPWLPEQGITHCNIRRSAWETLRSLLPDIIVATPSYRFLREIIKHSLHFQRKLLPLSAFEKLSLLILTAGKDSYVKSNVTKTVVKKMRQKCPKGGINIHNIHFEEAFHDILDEQDKKARETAIKSIISFLIEDTIILKDVEEKRYQEERLNMYI